MRLYDPVLAILIITIVVIIFMFIIKPMVYGRCPYWERCRYYSEALKICRSEPGFCGVFKHWEEREDAWK